MKNNNNLPGTPTYGHLHLYIRTHSNVYVHVCTVLSQRAPMGSTLTCLPNRVGTISSVSALNPKRALSFVYVHQKQAAASSKRACFRALPSLDSLAAYRMVFTAFKHSLRSRDGHRQANTHRRIRIHRLIVTFCEQNCLPQMRVEHLINALHCLSYKA